MSIKELRNTVDKIIIRYSDFDNKKNIINKIMGEVMKTARNRIDGKIVREIVERKINV